MEIGFLFNHEAHHQAFHSAPIAFALSRRYPGVAVTIIVSNEDVLSLIKEIGRGYPGHSCDYVSARVPLFHRGLDALARKWTLSVKKTAILKYNIDMFRQLDALVVPELTSLKLKSEFGLKNLKIIWTLHGAGDRAKGFDPRAADFSYVLLPGRKVLDRFLESGLLKSGDYKIVGYPKFDVTRPDIIRTAHLFFNRKPTVLYNPHYDRRESSWEKMGLRVLEYFYQNKEFNLIFAPHVVLFKRSLRHRARLPAKYTTCERIRVDIGSLASIDMTYTLAADMYLGDVSSQVYEFLVRPRPCVFLNAHGVRWQDNPNYLHWRSGAVLDDLSGLGGALAEAYDKHPQYRDIQRELFDYTFDLRPEPSSERAADAIAEYLGVSAHGR